MPGGGARIRARLRGTELSTSADGLALDAVSARAVLHGLQREARNSERGELLRTRSRLWIDQLELVAPAHLERRPRLGTDAQPVYARRWQDRSVGLHRDLEALGMERRHSLRVELQERLASRTHHQRPRARARVAWPLQANRPRQRPRRLELSAVLSHADKLRVAELADGRCTVALASGPEVAPGKATEDRWPSGVRPFALQRVENLLHRVHARGFYLLRARRPMLA